jgi:hypothetical protein
MTRHCGVSFLRHREIYPDADLIIGLGSCTATPRTHRNEFQPAIPRRVALLHCSLPLRQPHSFCTLKPNPSSYNQRAVTCPEFACLSPRAHSRCLVCGSVDPTPQCPPWYKYGRERRPFAFGPSPRRVSARQTRVSAPPKANALAHRTQVFQRPKNKNRLSIYVVARHESPRAAVVRGNPMIA